MELKYDAWRHRNVVVTLMNRVEHVTVSGYLPLVAVSWFDFLLHKLAQTAVGGGYVLYPVGCAGALDLCDFAQLVEDVGLSRDVERLLSSMLAHVP